jgi:protein arginine N-methyltransferase 1
MLDCVLWARDKYLVEGGLMFPDRATMFIATIEDEEYKNDKIHFWDSVYGFNMSNIKKWALIEPIVDPVDKKAINSNACAIFVIKYLNIIYKLNVELFSN